MTESHRMLTRRGAVVATLAAAGATASIAKSAVAADDPALAPRRHDWDWLVGRWRVRHSRLKARLAGSTEWEEFDGSSVAWLTLDGLGTVDDNVVELPSGTYRAVGIRAYDPKTGQWSIWWLDGRFPGQIEPPVRGGFKDGVGTFVGDDTLNGRPIKVRFMWSQITATSAHWEQAFSPDGGATWETNWRMAFTRVRA
ncbi:DUF1579 domain-containing protein [Phenylobacterium sp.]|uniref:DUF1579 domain-containing protein n=1 Tax=Phenylobacterium sp. TaxID=1871053 RepID=UPI002E2F128B|nr:DUF1579 domain-containing protein [Phenylobacterium sp.]HEX4710906.1 DUF1579 domain-containing protein [Phenylobacterium sp.]